MTAAVCILAASAQKRTSTAARIRVRSAPLPKLSSQRTLRWREMDSNFWYRGTKAVDFRAIALEAETGLDRYALARGFRTRFGTSPHRYRRSVSRSGSISSSSRP